MSPLKRAASPGRIMALLYVGYLLSFADRVIFGLVLKPIKATLHLSDTQLGLLSGVAFALSYAAFSPLGGYLVDRRPRKFMMAGAVAFWSAATFATGLAASFLTMALARIGVGVGESVLHPLSVSLVADTVEPDRRPRAFSLYLSAGAVGAVVALLFGGLLVQGLAKGHGVTIPGIGAVAPWRSLFMAAALPGFFLAAFVLVFMREPTRANATALDGAHPSGVSFLRRYPRLGAAVFGGVSLAQMGAYTITTWNINYFERVHHWQGSKAAIWLSLTSGVATIFGCVLAGPIIDAMRRRGVQDAPLRLCLIAAAAHATFGVLALLAPSPNLALMLFPLASFWGYVPSVCGFSALGEALPGPIRARLAGLHTFANGIISNSLGPFLVGFFSDTFFHQADGLRWALATTVALAGGVGVLVVWGGLSQYRERVTELQSGGHP